MIYSVLSFFTFLHFYNLVFSFIFPESYFFSIYFPSKKGIKISESKYPPQVPAKTHICHDVLCTFQLVCCRHNKQSLHDIELFTEAVYHNAERND